MNPDKFTSPRNLRRAAGFTLIELMVGMLVGLTATVVMFQVFAISEGQKRTTTGAGDAQQNGVGSVFSIERDARQGGFGMNYLSMVGCPVSGYNEGNDGFASPGAFTFQMAPYVIVNGAAATSSDSLTIAYGDTRAFASPYKIAKVMASAGAEIKTYNRFGLDKGDLFILASETLPCTLYQVQDRPGTDGIAHLPGSFTDPKNVTRLSNFNQGGGVAIQAPGTPAGLPGTRIAYPGWDTTKRKGGRIINLGQDPTVVTYRLQGNQLVADNVLVPGTSDAVVVADNIVQFQVQYAFDSDGDGSVASDAQMLAVLDPTKGDQWADSLPANPTSAMWAGIIGIRFALVARSVTPERIDSVTNKWPTEALPKWLATGRDLDVSADANWKSYRYRVFEVTVPARNLAWAPDETQ